MDDEDQERFRAKLADMIEGHKPIPTERLEQKIVEVAIFHQKAEDRGSEPPLAQVSPCILLSLMREVLLYRDRYGLIDMPKDWMPVDENGDTGIT